MRIVSGNLSHVLQIEVLRLKVGDPMRSQFRSVRTRSHMRSESAKSPKWQKTVNSDSRGSSGASVEPAPLSERVPGKSKIRPNYPVWTSRRNDRIPIQQEELFAVIPVFEGKSEVYPI